MFSFFKKIEQIFFYLFVISIPFEKRHIFETSFTQHDGHFIEWFSASLYLSDIFLLIFLFLWILRSLSQKIEAFNKKGVRSIFPQNKIFRNLLIIFTLFIIFGATSTLFSSSVKLSLYNLTSVFVYGLLFFYIITNINTIKKVLFTLLLFIGTAFIQAIFGLIQFLKQGSIGLKFLGEVDLNPTFLNVSKIVSDGDKLIRAYGSFPHSNVLGGFLFVSIIFALFFILIIINLQYFSLSKTKLINNKMFHVEHFKHLGLNKRFYENSLPIFVLIFYILILGLILTFSRSAWLALGFSTLFVTLLIIFITLNIRKKLIRSIRKIFYKINILIILIIFIFISILLLWPNISSRNPANNALEDEYSIAGRQLYSEISSEIIKDKLLLGVGPGLFVYKMSNYIPYELLWWQLQPVHNVFLLILAEHGIIGFILFIIFLFFIFKQTKHINFHKNESVYIEQLLLICLFSIILSFFIIMLFDHYLWTIRQGALTFWLLLALFFVSINIYQKKQIDH